MVNELENGVRLAMDKLAGLMGLDTREPSTSGPLPPSVELVAISNPSAPPPKPMALSTTHAMRARFLSGLSDLGFERRQAQGDGFCLFHSIAMGLDRVDERQDVHL